MMRGSNVTRTTPRAGASVRSTAWAATTLAPPVMAGHARRRAIRRVRISKTAPAGWRMPCSLPRGTDGVRAQGTVGTGIAERYLALIASKIFLAISRCVAVLGWTPSHERARPNGEPLHAAAVFGNGASCPGTPRKESRVGFGFIHAH